MKSDPHDVLKWTGIKVKDGRVTSINWISERLTGTVPAEIGQLSALTKICLRNNELVGEVPFSICNLTNLKELTLRQNMQLTDELPSSFVKLTNLRKIDLYQTKIANGPRGHFNYENWSDGYGDPKGVESCIHGLLRGTDALRLIKVRYTGSERDKLDDVLTHLGPSQFGVAITKKRHKEGEVQKIITTLVTRR